MVFTSILHRLLKVLLPIVTFGAGAPIIASSNTSRTDFSRGSRSSRRYRKLHDSISAARLGSITTRLPRRLFAPHGSAALQRAHDLNRIARRQRCDRPFGAAHDGAVDGHGEQFGNRRHRDLGLFAVDAQPRHRAPAMPANRAGAGSAAKRSGENGRAMSGSWPRSI